ncbi:hypothetical protein AVCANL279_08855 [Campylobacter canadensis]|uniref:hypothetical protein n=1 Tax=Campylobacter canadensis TaxID=449520 RepID=UPI0015562BFB|nr:hypothetical protein [Campylobacter canadensis]MBZ7995617.1 hypothetical protein [Campylobacter canadensis]MBZ7997416.1 hypothetical protein [Campylobacter canadensis]MBZ8000946.1 hypothetical protein [Campylobacter canadensis]MBZ8002785.1 hypothetical protein [Campylobacter canadensis]MBZ8003086.1 hypothetical protein [Campylobacter canadensis]
MLPIILIRTGITVALAAIGCGSMYYIVKEKEKYPKNTFKLYENIYNKNNNIIVDKISKKDIENLFKTNNVTDFINEMYKLFYENMAKNKFFPKKVNKDNDNFMKYLYAVRNTIVHSKNNSYKYIKQYYELLCRKLEIPLCDYKDLDENSRFKIKNYFLQELDNYLNRVILELNKNKEK